VIEWLLEQVEKDPTTLFRKRDLLDRSQPQFEQLRNRGLLVYVQTDPEDETYPCQLPCARACPKQIVQMQGRFYAMCPEDSEIDPMLLGEDDLHKYVFSVEALLQEIRKANGLSGSLSCIEPDYYYMGHTTCDARRVGLVFVASMKGKGVLELCGLRRVCTDDDVLVVLSPISAIDDISMRAGLGREKVIHTSLIASLDLNTFSLSTERLLAALGDDSHTYLQAAHAVSIEGVTKWAQVFMEVVDDSTVKMRSRAGAWRKLTYVELGFKDERTGLPNKLWEILLSLAEQNRRIVNPPRITPKDIHRLRNTLRAVFGLRGMPIERYDQVAKRYPCCFHFRDPRDW
jgi:hypothetical protein